LQAFSYFTSLDASLAALFKYFQSLPLSSSAKSAAVEGPIAGYAQRTPPPTSGASNAVSGDGIEILEVDRQDSQLLTSGTEGEAYECPPLRGLTLTRPPRQLESEVLKDIFLS